MLGSWIEKGLGRNRVTLPEFAWEKWGAPQKISVIIASVPTEIQTEYLPNTILDRYHHSGLSYWGSPNEIFMRLFFSHYI
jgi:hypothetical protein